MKLTRRTLLQSAGAVASAAAASGPGGVAAATGARETALAAGRGPYLVVGDNGALQLCQNYHDAVHQASALRHTTMGQAQYMRCSPALMSQLQADPSTPWVDVDGLGVTPDEAVSRGFDFLRRARDPAKTRRLLWHHHFDALHTRIESADLADPKTRWYAVHDGNILGVKSTKRLADTTWRTEQCDPEIHACSPPLASAIAEYLSGDELKPVIDTGMARHMTVAESAVRLENDRPFAIANTRPDEIRVPFDQAAVDAVVNGSIETAHGWLLPRAVTAPDHHHTTISGHLSAALEANGFIMPGFWKRVRNVRHHLDEFADNVPAPSLLGKTVHHQNRHA